DRLGLSSDRSRRRRWSLMITVAAIIIAAGSLGVVVLRSSLLRPNAYAWERFATEGRLTRLLSSEPTGAAPALSPDGAMLAFVATDAQGQSDLYVTRVSGSGELRLTTDRAFEQYPRF